MGRVTGKVALVSDAGRGLAPTAELVEALDRRVVTVQADVTAVDLPVDAGCSQRML